jgi:hypothetical protein
MNIQNILQMMKQVSEHIRENVKVIEMTEVSKNVWGKKNAC